jgi:hypothetical protein
MADARPVADYRHRLGAIAAAPMSGRVIFNVSTAMNAAPTSRATSMSSYFCCLRRRRVSFTRWSRRSSLP